MKTYHFNLLLLIISGLIFQGCWGGNYYPTSYNVNTEKFISTRNYEKEQPFSMKDQLVNVPLISRKDQFNIALNVVHGINSSFTYAISRRMFVFAGVTFENSNNTQSESASFEATRSVYNTTTNAYDQNNYSTYLDYDKYLSQESSSINLGLGFYKCFGKSGRWEYHAGYSRGEASSSYTYSFENYNNSYTRTYGFKENRKFSQVYVQTDFGYVTEKTEGAVVGRFSWYNFFTQEFTGDFPIPVYEMDKNQYVFQPAVHFAYGRVFRLFMQVGWNVPLGKSQLEWFPTNVQFGILIKYKDRDMI